MAAMPRPSSADTALSRSHVRVWCRAYTRRGSLISEVFGNEGKSIILPALANIECELADAMRRMGCGSTTIASKHSQGVVALGSAGRSFYGLEMAEQPTVGTLFKSKDIDVDALHAAVDAYLADPTTTEFPLGGGYVLDLAAAVEAHPASRKALADPKESPVFKRTMVHTAIILAHPRKA